MRKASVGSSAALHVRFGASFETFGLGLPNRRLHLVATLGSPPTAWNLHCWSYSGTTPDMCSAPLSLHFWSPELQSRATASTFVPLLRSWSMPFKGPWPPTLKLRCSCPRRTSAARWSSMRFETRAEYLDWLHLPACIGQIAHGMTLSRGTSTLHLSLSTVLKASPPTCDIHSTYSTSGSYP